MPTDEQFNPLDDIRKAQGVKVPTFDPREDIARARGESPRQQTKRVVGEILQNEFDAETTAPMGMRWSLARGDTFEEKQARLKKFHENGELRVLGKSGVAGLPTDVLVWRESPEQKWKMVEPEGFDAFDIPEAVAGSAEAIGGEAAMAIASRGASVPGLIARQGIGAFFGEGIEQAEQSMSGVQRQDYPGIIGEMSLEGASSIVGGAAASPLVGLSNMARGAGAVHVGESGLESLRAAHRLDPELARNMPAGLVSDNPTVQYQAKQAAALLPSLNRRYRELIQKVDNIVKSKIDDDVKNQAMSRVTRSVQDLSRTFLDQVGSPRSPMSRGGRALQQGIKEYDEGATSLINSMYDYARGIEEPTFNLEAVPALAGDLRAGKLGTIDPSVDSMLKELESITGPRPLSDGVLSVTDQLRNVRTQAFALKNPPPGQVAGQKEGQAAAIYRQINKILDAPTNANPAFKKAWKEASTQAAARFDTMGQAAVIAAQKSENPADLVRRFAQPGQPDNLAALRLTAPRQYWDEFVDAFKSDLISDPAKLSGKLKAFDQETLDVLLTRQEQAQFSKLGVELGRIAEMGVGEMAERQVSNKQFMAKLIESSDPRDAVTLMRAFNNTNDKAARQSVQSAIIDWVWDGVVREKDKALSINRDLFNSRIETLQKNGFIRILPKEAREMLLDTDKVARVFQSITDAGVSLIGASAAHKITRLAPSAIMTYIQAGIQSKLYLSEFGRALLIGSGKPSSQGKVLRVMAGAAAQTLPPEDISGMVSQDNPRMKFAETR